MASSRFGQSSLRAGKATFLKVVGDFPFLVCIFWTFLLKQDQLADF